MRPIIEYRDYRQYVLDYYKERKDRSGFTWREFAKVAGYASGSYLKLVCDGKSRLTSEGAKKTSAAMNLVGFEEQYFLLMVDYGNAKTDAQKKKSFEEMIALAAAHKQSVLGANFYTYFESWKNPVLRELAPAMPHALPSQLADQCLPQVSAAEVVDSLRFLTKNDLLAKDDNGVYHQTKRSISTGPMDVVPEAVRSMHRQMGTFALKALDELPLSERSFSGLTLGITKKAYKQIIKELARCRERIIAIATADEDTEQVYRVNMQFFPLTKKLEKSNQPENGGSHE
ncbi:MAG: TIGR02147 family protein [Fibrobacter sp.]|nr:TIGR02147 family protein [Fibrobacter sp.]